VNPNLTGQVIQGGPNRYFNPSAFLQPLPGTYGNVGRNILQGPALVETDLSLTKKFALSERWNMQFRAEFFNMFNHTKLQRTESGHIRIRHRRTVAHGRSDYSHFHYVPSNSVRVEADVVMRLPNCPPKLF